MSLRKNLKRNWQFLESNDNCSTTYKKLWDTMKAVLSKKFITVSAHQKYRFSLNSLLMHFKSLEKKGAPKSKTSWTNNIMHIRTEFNKRKAKKWMQRVSESKTRPLKE